MKKRWLRNEWRRGWKIGKRREVGRTPNWVYQQRKEKVIPDDPEG
jgi:hypothetical protein